MSAGWDKTKIVVAGIGFCGVWAVGVLQYFATMDATATTKETNTAITDNAMIFDQQQREWAREAAVNAQKYNERADVCRGLQALDARFIYCHMTVEEKTPILKKLKPDFFAGRSSIPATQDAQAVLKAYDEVRKIVDSDTDSESDAGKEIAKHYNEKYYEPIEAAMRVMLTECTKWRDEMGPPPLPDAGAHSK